VSGEGGSHLSLWLLNNPGYWGSSNPKILVLGFSSGDILPSVFTNPTTFEIIQRCASTFLKRLPGGVELVVH